LNGVKLERNFSFFIFTIAKASEYWNNILQEGNRKMASVKSKSVALKNAVHAESHGYEFGGP
jgi:hypothetical protein